MGATMDLTGQTFGRLRVLERAGRCAQGVTWACACECGGAVVLATATLRRGHTRSCGCLQRERASHDASKRNARAVVSYVGLHLRLARTRGAAKAHPCVDCGERASQWSYDNTDPAALTSDQGAYSLDLTRYQPRCVPCHKAYDAAQRLAPATAA